MFKDLIYKYRASKVVKLSTMFQNIDKYYTKAVADKKFNLQKVVYNRIIMDNYNLGLRLDIQESNVTDPTAKIYIEDIEVYHLSTDIQYCRFRHSEPKQVKKEVYRMIKELYNLYLDLNNKIKCTFDDAHYAENEKLKVEKDKLEARYGRIK